MMKAMPDPRPRKHVGYEHKNGEQKQEQQPAQQPDANVEEVVNIDNEAHADAVNGDIQPAEAVEAREEEA